MGKDDKAKPAVEETQVCGFTVWGWVGGRGGLPTGWKRMFKTRKERQAVVKRLLQLAAQVVEEEE